MAQRSVAPLPPAGQRGTLRARLSRVHERVRGGTEPGSGERGTSMVELLVGMVIMTICGAIFTSSVVTLQRTSNQAQALTNSATQNNQAFQTLDRTVRYAAAISTPGRSTGAGATGDWYVELRTTTSGAEICTQLRVDIVAQQLQSRTWTSANPTGTLSTWTPIASSITNGAAATGATTQPFYPMPAGTTVSQALTFNLISVAGPASQRTSSASSFTLTALNSLEASPTSPVCQQIARP